MVIVFILLFSSLQCFGLSQGIEKNEQALKKLDKQLECMKHHADDHCLGTCFDEKLNIQWFENPSKLNDNQLIVSRARRDLANVSTNIRITQSRIEDVSRRNALMESKIDNL